MTALRNEPVVSKTRPEYMPIINVDVDGVLYDFTGAMRLEVAAVMGIPREELPDPETWELQKSWPLTHDQVFSIMYDGITQGRVFRNGAPVEPGLSSHMALEKLIAYGWHVRLVTSKTFNDPFVTHMARVNMLSWIEKHEIPHHTISFTDSYGKRSYRADAIVDDKPDLSWAQWGADNFLYDNPWNANTETDENQVTRVKRLSDVADFLTGVSE